MKIADLYIRVSTDEQADKGYSQRNQEEDLRRYCGLNNIQIRDVIFEDHSAKNFDRPKWGQLMLKLKKRSSKINLILFTKWDRFSRNAGDAYQMISTLSNLGIEPQAIEQPLDLSIPENKMMLAFYLAAPEVENDRRALNVFHGMRRAKKEGRVMGNAPYGYINRSKEDGRKYIAIKEPEASNLKWAFNEIAKGIYSANDVRARMKDKISKSRFYVALRNPVYCGKVFIERYKDEEAHLVQGQHEPLINEALFLRVQDILDKNVKKVRPNTKMFSEDNLPLRGFLVCPKCNRNLTGSASKGRTKHYYYYHCIPSCGFRHRADEVNNLFEKELRNYEFPSKIKKTLSNLILDSCKSFILNTGNKKKEISDQIDELNSKMSKARDMLLLGKIDDEDYKIIKSESKEKIDWLENELSRHLAESKEVNINVRLEKALMAITNISSMYQNADIELKRFIIGSIYPEKLEFDGNTYRTIRRNVIAEYIFKINRELRNKKSGNYESIFHNSRLVLKTGLEPVRTLLSTGF